MATTQQQQDNTRERMPMSVSVPPRSNIDFVITVAIVVTLLTSFAHLPSPALASVSASAVVRDQSEYSTRRRRRRRRRRGQQSLPSSSSISLKTKQLRINSGSRRQRQQQQYEALRERWVEILALNQLNNNNNNGGVRSANQLEQRYHYEVEVFTDTLLGIDDDHEIDSVDDYDESIQNYCDTRCKRTPPSLISKEISIIWKSTVIASSVLLIGFPVAGFVWRILSSSMIPPPSFVSIIKATVVNYILQAQAILHSTPYLIRHLNQIRIVPRPKSLLTFMLKVIRKCIIIEAWRHIWIQVYKLTRFARRRLTLHNAKLAYVRICPAWIRRGIKSILQSSVQAQVHGAVGGLLTVSPFENFAWSGNSDENIIGSNIDSFTDSSQSMADEFIMDPSSVQQAFLEETAKSISEETMDVVVSVEGIDLFEMGEVVESVVEECLSEGIC